MNKDELELTKDICPDYDTMCDKCNANGVCTVEYTAKRLINKNYRKIADDEVVIKKSEYDILLRDYALTYDNAYQWGLKVGEEKTATEILQELKEKQIFMLENDLFGGNAVLIQSINELANKYGVELGG